jgi:tetratricopeptide (TPR) repeat protein/predicted Ser/Thr protein kinase
LFHKLLDLPPEARAAEAVILASGDQSLAEQALKLVAAFDQAQQANREVLARNLNAGSANAKQFGAYRTIRLLGTGGMGAVYLAERSDGQFQHQVAVKVIGQHIAGPGFEKRFREERQILAGLVHPNIARLLDGNVSEHGEPYLVLEYVDGEPLDAYCDKRGLDQNARIRLFVEVCGAVEFAHRNLVVHRDLKPSNILVTADGEPKLLDFGAARLLSAESSGATIPMLTLRYASPEQLQNKPVNTVSDVYSLGVVLYELLAGRPPFEGGDSWELALRRAVEDVPIEPTTSLQGDLWTIIRKALSRESERRYSSVREFAEDLERYLAGRPILARPSTLGYRASKFVRRNRFGVAAAVLLTAAVLIGAVSTLWQARRAQRRFDELHQLARFLMIDLNSGLQRVAGTTALQRESVERSLEYLDSLAKEAGGDATLRTEVAEGYLSLGDVLGNPFRPNLGERAKAESAYKSGLATIQGLSATRNVRRVAAKLHLQLGGTRSFSGEPGPGLAEIRGAVADLKKLASEAPGEDGLILDAAKGLEFLATRVTAGGGTIEGAGSAEAIQLFDQSRQLAQSILTKAPEHPGALRQLAQVENSQALLYGSTEPARALEHHRLAIRYLDRLPPGESVALDTRRVRASILLNTGWAEGQSGAHADALDHITEAGEILKAWSSAEPENTHALYQLAGMYRGRGIIHSYRKDAAPAIEDFTSAADLHRRLSAKDPANNVYRFLRGELLLRSANWQLTLGRATDARTSAQEGLAIIGRLASAPSASLTHVFGACRWFSETEVREVRDPARAAGFCRQAIERTKGSELDAFLGLAGALDLLGDPRGAVEAAEKALALLPPSVGSGSQQRRDTKSALARYRSKLPR